MNMLLVTIGGKKYRLYSRGSADLAYAAGLLSTGSAGPGIAVGAYQFSKSGLSNIEKEAEATGATVTRHNPIAFMVKTLMIGLLVLFGIVLLITLFAWQAK